MCTLILIRKWIALKWNIFSCVKCTQSNRNYCCALRACEPPCVALHIVANSSPYIFFAFNCMYVAEKQFFILLILAQILSFFRFIVLHLANDCGISNYTNKKRREKRNIFVFLRLTDKIHLIQRHEQSIWNWQRKRKQHTFHRRICKTFLRLIYIHESRHVLYIIKLKLLKCNLEKCTKLKWNF